MSVKHIYIYIKPFLSYRFYTFHLISSEILVLYFKQVCNKLFQFFEVMVGKFKICINKSLRIFKNQLSSKLFFFLLVSRRAFQTGMMPGNINRPVLRNSHVNVASGFVPGRGMGGSFGAARAMGSLQGHLGSQGKCKYD